MIQQLNDVSDIVTSNFKRALTSTLDYHGFTAEQTDLYYELGALPSIVRSSMRFYMSLLIKLRQYAQLYAQGLHLHNGGKTQCLFKDLSAIKARSHAREADQQLRANPGQCLNDIVKALLSPFNN
mmetsp:Transcript_7321/g.17277  ORF Transcript_7321/g.17277 Transcript_7321/m.17277 type:complete len:125 (+) Transcript_7321:1407-1781(+)